METERIAFRPRIGSMLLILSALEQGSANGHYHAVDDEGVPFQKIAESIGEHLRVPIMTKSPAEATKHFGFLGHLLASTTPHRAH